MDRPIDREKGPGGTGGYSLIELLLALSLVLILALGLSGFDPLTALRRWRTREAALRVHGLLRRARWRAISENREYAVDFGISSEDGTWQALLLYKAGSWEALEEPLPLSLDPARLSITGSSRKEFNPDGTSSSGSVIISGDGGLIYRISLTAATGRIRLYHEGN